LWRFLLLMVVIFLLVANESGNTPAILLTSAAFALFTL
jgi:hypothetical protein